MRLEALGHRRDAVIGASARRRSCPCRRRDRACRAAGRSARRDGSARPATSCDSGPKSWPTLSSAEKLMPRKSVPAPRPSFIASIADIASALRYASENGLDSHASVNAPPTSSPRALDGVRKLLRDERDAAPALATSNRRDTARSAARDPTSGPSRLHRMLRDVVGKERRRRFRKRRRCHPPAVALRRARSPRRAGVPPALIAERAFSEMLDHPRRRRALQPHFVRERRSTSGTRRCCRRP